MTVKFTIVEERAVSTDNIIMHCKHFKKVIHCDTR